MDFIRIGSRRSWRLSIDEASDYLSLDLFRSLDFSNREVSNAGYIPSPTRAVRLAIQLLLGIDPGCVEGTFIDCAAGKGKPSLVAMKLGYRNIVQVERDDKTFRVLSENFSIFAKHYSNVSQNLILGDFLTFDHKAIDIKIHGPKATFWLFDLQEALPDFLARIEILCQSCSVTNAVVLLLSEKNLPPYANWENIAYKDLGYDGSRHIWLYKLKNTQ